jgi:hypothetical protein
MLDDDARMIFEPRVHLGLKSIEFRFSIARLRREDLQLHECILWSSEIHAVLQMPARIPDSPAESRSHMMNSVCWFVCQGACGLGGQDWVGPHREVGRLVSGHTARRVLVGRRRQIIIRTASADASAGR